MIEIDSIEKNFKAKFALAKQEVDDLVSKRDFHNNESLEELIENDEAMDVATKADEKETDKKAI